MKMRHSNIKPFFYKAPAMKLLTGKWILIMDLSFFDV